MTHRMRSHSYTLSLTLSSFSHIPSKSRLQTRTPSIPTSPNHETASGPQVRLKPCHQKTKALTITPPRLISKPRLSSNDSSRSRLPTPSSQLPTTPKSHHRHQDAFPKLHVAIRLPRLSRSGRDYANFRQECVRPE
jgi:hypothetical protein